MAATYFVTPHGTRRHTTWSCARVHQPIGATEPVKISEQAAITGYLACSECCTAADVKASETAQAAKADAYCPNSGLVPANPRRLYRTCRDCGYEGKVGRNGLRAHKPQSA